MKNETLPKIIQGGMGVGVSTWGLARAVAKAGQIGVVSGTGVDTTLVRHLQLGDRAAVYRRAMAAFPFQDMVGRILDRFFIDGGKPADAPFKLKPIPSIKPGRLLQELTVIANFVEVFLAKEGHDGHVGINYLEKIQTPTLLSLYGAMLAGVGWIFMGAGIPRTIPEILDRLAVNQSVELKIDVQGARRGESFLTRFEPEVFAGRALEPLPRPRFVPIVSAAPIAAMLVRRAKGTIDGFVVEDWRAGGHNAPPRGKTSYSPEGEPIYTDRDVPDLESLRTIGLPFWLAGSQADRTCIDAALAAGATGVQIGTAFAFCEESGLDPKLKRQVLELSRDRRVGAFTDPRASPTGFPFKVIPLPGTAAVSERERNRVCELGYLRHAYRKENGSVGWRCPAEPVEDYIAKGGSEQETLGRLCVCNALLANIGLGQIRADGSQELPLLTSGIDVETVARFVPEGASGYNATDVISQVLAL
jgi:nitronate monooxygenase